MNAKLLSAGLSTICIVVLTGCAHIGITAYAQPEPSPGKRFVLEGPDPRYPGGDPAWPVYSLVLTKALEVKGFVPVASSPDLIIRVGYGMGDTRTSTTTTSTPTMGYTATTQTVFTPNSDPSGPPIVSTVTTPVWGVVGSTDSTSTSSTSRTTIRIEALDAASYTAGKPTVVWSTHATTRSLAEAKLSQLFPYMVAAMEDYFGVNVPKEIDVAKYPDDPEVTRLKEALDHFPGAPGAR